MRDDAAQLSETAADDSDTGCELCGVQICTSPKVSKTHQQSKGKKEVDLYSAFIVVPHTQGAQVRITVLPANYTVPAFTS